MAQHTIGFVYVLSNAAMPGIVKVGRTSKLTEDRAGQLQTTGVPVPFTVEFRTMTSHPKAVEAEAHALLAPVRIASDREFFKTSPPRAIAVVQNALLSTSSIAAWDSNEPHHVRHCDRVALTLEAGDLFVVLSYSHNATRIRTVAEPRDIWQAHQDGDLLELMGTRQAGHVAGFGDGDPDGDTDPVPFLDRTRATPNGSINGRERLVPGERLLWLRPTAGGTSCMMAVCAGLWHPVVCRLGGH